MTLPICKMKSCQPDPLQARAGSVENSEGAQLLKDPVETLKYCLKQEDIEELIRLLSCDQALPDGFASRMGLQQEFAWIDQPAQVSGVALYELCRILHEDVHRPVPHYESYCEKLANFVIINEDTELMPALNINLKLGRNVGLSLLMVLMVTEFREFVKAAPEGLRKFWTTVGLLAEESCSLEISALRNAVLVLLSTLVTGGNTKPMMAAEAQKRLDKVSPMVREYWCEAMVRAGTNMGYAEEIKEFNEARSQWKEKEKALETVLLDYSGKPHTHHRPR